MRTILIILTFVSHFSFSQTDYNETLSKRIEEIKNREIYDNSIVILADTSQDKFFGFPRWTETQVFYMNDMASVNGKLYECLKDSIVGKNPETSLSEWRLSISGHPYYFLRDTAKTDDLKILLKDVNPFVRTYSFAALAKRRYADIFQILLDNLKDKTKISIMTYDVGTDEYVSDMMITYVYESLNNKQKDRLRKEILTKYKYLRTPIKE